MPDDYFFVNGENIIQPRSCDIEVKALDDCRLWEIDCNWWDRKRVTSNGMVSFTDVFLVNPASTSSVLLRQKILKKCREDIYHFLNHENGQVAIYDAVNPLAAGRRSLAKEFAKHDVEV